MGKKRVLFMAALFALSFLAVIGRLAYLQFIDGEELAVIGSQQKIRSVELTQYPRGEVLDRNGEQITNTEEEPALLIFPSLINDPEEDASTIGAVIDVGAANLLQKIQGTKEDGTEIRRLPFVAKSKLSNKETDALQELNLPGTFIVGQVGRYQEDYPALHILGQLGKVTSEDILEEGMESYNEGDVIGTSGLEKIYEDVLKAESGERLGLLVDERNRFIQGEGYFIYDDEEGEKSGSISLTLDLELQRVVESAFGENQGAAVVLDVDTGDILAIASSPKYDPYFVTLPEEDDAYVNKALQTYPPASLFKIVLAAAALEEGIVTTEEEFFCPGYYSMIGGDTIACWKEEGHQTLTFGEALGESCNTVFLNVGLELGGEKITEYFEKWELDKETIIGYPLSDKTNLDFNTSLDADTANVILGEKGIQITPVNLAKMINVIATGGFLLTPRLVTEVRNGEGELEQSFPGSYPLRIVSEDIAEKVKDMMERTFIDGTAENLNMQSLTIAGKTGTSETGNVWIGGFFPADDPQYTVVILVEEGDSGVVDAGPVFKKIAGYLQNT